MAKVTGPLLSFGGSGTIAKTQTYAKWRGVQYVRQYVKPENPNTSEQQLTRSAFKTLNQMWTNAPADLKAAWDRYAAGRQFTGRNAFIGKNLEIVRSDPTFANFTASPGAGGGIPPVSILATPTAGGASVAIDVPASPTGWTLTKAQVVAFPDQLPGDNFTGAISQGSDDTAPFEVNLTGLTPDAPYVVSAWLVWMTENNRVAFSPSLVTTVTPD